MNADGRIINLTDTIVYVAIHWYEIATMYDYAQYCNKILTESYPALYSCPAFPSTVLHHTLESKTNLCFHIRLLQDHPLACTMNWGGTSSQNIQSLKQHYNVNS